MFVLPEATCPDLDRTSPASWRLAAAATAFDVSASAGSRHQPPPLTGSEATAHSLMTLVLLLGHLKRVRRTGWLMHGIGSRWRPPDLDVHLGFHDTGPGTAREDHRDPSRPRDSGPYGDGPVLAAESDADHMWRMAVMAWLMAGQEMRPLDGDRMVRLALVHDLAEALVGDLTPYDNVTKEEKHRRELQAMVLMTSLLPTPTPPPLEAAQGAGPTQSVGAAILDAWKEYEDARSRESRAVHCLDKVELVVQAWEYELISAQFTGEARPFSEQSGAGRAGSRHSSTQSGAGKGTRGGDKGLDLDEFFVNSRPDIRRKCREFPGVLAMVRVLEESREAWRGGLVAP